MVQHVKCSPFHDRSNPTEEMWNKCGSYVLKDELRILAPKRAIALGSGANARAFRANVLSGAERPVQLGSKEATLRLERGELPAGSVDFVVVPHPASRGGTSHALVAAFRDLVTAPSVRPV
jgi:uracil-DNA glycosylase